jgi:hypothetical protein
MTKSLLIIFIAALSNSFLGWPLIAQTAKDIVGKADKKRMGNSSQSTISLTVVRPTWHREMNLMVWTKGNEHLPILITSPARDKGTPFLKRGKEFWNWIPRINRNVKLPPSAMGASLDGVRF